MNEKILKHEETKQISAVIHALEHGIKACNNEEKRLIKRFVSTQKTKLREYQEKNDEIFFKALESFANEKR